MRFIGVTIVFFLLLATASAQQDPFNGSWKLDVTKSKMQPATASKSEIIQYEIVGDEERFVSQAVTMKDEAESIKYAARYNDGKAYPFTITINGKVTNPNATTMVKKVDTWTRERYNVRDGKPVLASRRIVSQDGKTMTITIVNVDAQGKEAVVETRLLEKQPQAAAAAQRPRVTVLIAAENPALRLLDKEGGKALTEVNFWRAQWSPVGAGAVCFVTIRDSGDANLRVAITDNEKLADYIINSIMGGFGGPNRFNTPPYAISQGSITQSNVGASQRTETCKSDRYDIAITWKDLGGATWVPEFRPGNGDVVQSFVMVQAKGAQVMVNGKQAPGSYFPTGGGFGPGAYLTLNEAWRREEK